MDIKFYNPLDETLIKIGIIKSKAKIVQAKNFDGFPEVIGYYPEEKFFFSKKSKPKFFGTNENYIFNKDTIESLVIKDKSQKVEKSIVKIAIVGGLIGGDTGAIVGGMTGLKDSYKYFKQVIINDKFKFSFEEAEYLKIKDFFEEIFNELYKEEKELENKSEVKSDPFENLKKLKELLDLGIITQDEYNEKREKFLNQI